MNLFDLHFRQDNQIISNDVQLIINSEILWFFGKIKGFPAFKMLTVFFFSQNSSMVLNWLKSIF